MKQVYIVEDEAVVALELKDHLRELGYGIAGHAARGEVALREILEKRPDLVLMDIKLGSSLSGLEVAERVRAVLDVPVIFLTAFSDVELTEQASKSGSFMYMVKPFEPRVLAANIELVTERHALERELRARGEALAESEARYRSLFSEAIEGIFRTRLDGTLVDANPAFARLLGRGDAAELIGRSVLELCDRAACWTALEERLANPGASGPFEVCWRRASGEHVWVDVHGHLVRDAAGACVGYQGYARDVTSERLHNGALRVLSAGLNTLRGTRLFEELARQLAALLGADVGFVVARERGGPAPLAWVVDGSARPPDEVPRTLVEVIAGLATPCAPDLAAVGAVDYLSASFYDRAGQLAGSVGVLARHAMARSGTQDAVARLFALRAAEELDRQRDQARFEVVFDAAPDALLIVDEAGTICQANRMAARTFGRSREELLGLSVDALVPAAQQARHAELRRRLEDHGVGYRMGVDRPRLNALRADGALVPVEIGLSPLHLAGERLTVAAVRDVTERVRAEEERERLREQLQHARRLEAIGTFASGIAHDFNNLLATIVANMECAAMELGPEHPVRAHLDEIARASERAADLVRQVLAFGSRQPARRASVEVGPLLWEVARQLRTTVPGRVRITVDVAAGVAPVLGDPTQLHQVVMNLAKNACQAIDGEGSVLLAAAPAEVSGGVSPVAGLMPGRYVRLRVRDDGCGMPAETLERIFEPFFTTKGVGRGTGLGLAVVHGIVTASGGAISVESVPGRGSTFDVYLAEATRPAAADSPPTHHGDPAPKPSGRVLLVDDEEPLVRAGGRLLTRLGYDVTGAVGAEQALALFREDPCRFDAMVTDVSMPGLDGLALAREVTRLRPGFPVVLCSGHRVYSDAELREASAVGFLGKPYTLSALGKAMQAALGCRSA